MKAETAARNGGDDAPVEKPVSPLDRPGRVRLLPCGLPADSIFPLGLRETIGSIDPQQPLHVADFVPLVDSAGEREGVVEPQRISRSADESAAVMAHAVDVRIAVRIDLRAAVGDHFELER